MPRIEFFGLSRGRAPYRLATFSPVSKSEPAKVSIVELPDGKLVSSKSIFRADEAKFAWNNTGSAVRVWSFSANACICRLMHAFADLIFCAQLPNDGVIF